MLEAFCDIPCRRLMSIKFTCFELIHCSAATFLWSKFQVPKFVYTFLKIKLTLPRHCGKIFLWSTKKTGGTVTMRHIVWCTTAIPDI